MEKLKYDWNGKTILIAEDEDMNYFLLSEAFSKTGAIIIRAFNGIEVVEKFQKLPQTDLILMDIKMPLMNGYEAGMKIREISDVPIIAQTAYAMAGEETKSKSSGCNAYISKPMKIAEIMALIDGFLFK
jgi:CheY-like chemotaxis protein